MGAAPLVLDPSEEVGTAIYLRVGDGASSLRVSWVKVRVVWWKHGGRRADHRTY